METSIATTGARPELDARAARLRAGRYYGARPDVFAEGYSVSIDGGWGGEATITEQGRPGATATARRHFGVTSESERWTDEETTYQAWTHHVGREGHGIVLRFIEEVAP